MDKVEKSLAEIGIREAEHWHKIGIDGLLITFIYLVMKTVP